MRNINWLKKMQVIKTIKKFLILNSIFLILILVYVYFSNSKSKTEDYNLSKTEQLIESWYSTVDKASEFSKNNNDYMPLDVKLDGIQYIKEKYGNIPIYTDEQGNNYITYESFDTSSEEGFDNYQAIYDAHIYANYYGYNIKATLDTYHIYKLEQTNFIHVQTNTDWNNATFIIHDEGINNIETRNNPIFKIEAKQSGITITDRDILDKIQVTKTTTNIPELSGYGNAICIIYNENKMQYIRYGVNQDAGRSQRDFFKIDNDGNVLNEIQWDFDYISEILILPIPEETIIVENGNFITILPEQKFEQDSGYFLRNIYCNRSNTIIQNINHKVNNKDYIGGPYKGFINLYEVSDVIVKDSTLFSHKYENKSNYDLFIEYAVDIKIENVTSNDIEDPNRWGIVGTDYTKDIVYENCTLNRIDAHTGVHNLTIDNCTIGIKGITVIGSGDLNIINSTIKSNNYLIELRQDYGSTWNGNIYITNCIYEPKNSQQLIYFYVSYDDENTLHNFGYDLYLPNIFIDGLIINDTESTYIDNNIYLFYNNEYYTGTNNGDISEVYTLPEEIFINNYETTSGRKIKLFFNDFYDSLENLGIYYSVPLEYKENVKIISDTGIEINSNIITNESITITYNKVEGINTKIIINENENKNSKIELMSDGVYEIQIIYSNYSGQIEEEHIVLTVDKTSPTITGIKDGQTSTSSVKPVVEDTNLSIVSISYNGENIEYYDGITLEDEGMYSIVATDRAGNTTTVQFNIISEVQDNYIIKDNYLLNVWQETTLTDFKNNYTSQGESYIIKRNDTELTDTDIIATGDTIELSSGDTYTIIVAGDINCDGKVTVFDLSALRRYILKQIEFTEIELLSADINLDYKQVGVMDYSRMRIEILSRY